ncbi:PAS domain S-box protein [Virgibacillus sp. MSP4-1]|uniref:PAS domain-containing sensor histidine kinase n=1 Tax=Virgibacillus sp. MSP4-1 TaxID=2700081 RepID=UPI00039E272A|nr:PAS domain-containing sensor histidine kinase [Virgibacillus sp. MSP4-1]QHS23679.1 PAS domain S-box protein [Virgibacillus sp. MSP4-1]
MKKILPARLTKRFIVLGLFLIMIPLFVILYLGVMSSKDIVDNQTENQAIQVTKSLSNQTTNLFEYKMKLLENISVTDRLTNHASEWPRSAITDLAVNDAFFQQIYLVSQDGQILHQAPTGQEGMDNLPPKLQPILNELKWRRSSFSSTVVTKNNRPPGIFIAVPLQAEEHGEVHSGFIAQVSVDFLQKNSKQNIVGQEGRSFLLDQDGTVLIDTNDNKSMGLRLTSPVVEEGYSGRTGIRYGSVLQEKVLIAYSPVDHLPFLSVTTIPVDHVNAATKNLTFSLIMGLVVLTIAVTILLYFSVKWVIKPINALTEEANQYVQGGKWKFNLLQEKDEVKTLSKALNYMATSLKEKERYLQLILGSFPFGVITMDPLGNVTSVNDKAKELLNRKHKRLKGKSISALPVPLKEHFETCKNASSDFEGIKDEYIYRNLYGRKLVLRRFSSPLLDETGQVIGVVTTFWDITKVRQLEQHIQRSEQLAAIGQMTAGLAHEVKNPLGTIQMASDLIESEFKELENRYSFKGKDPETIKEALNDIQDETDRMNELVKSFLQFSRETKKEESIIDLTELVNEILHLLSHQMKQKKIEINTIYPEEQAFVKGDRNQITQALLNVFLNSMDAVEQQGKIEVTIEKVDQQYVLEVMDDGVGISQSKMKRIFNPFYSTKQEGTGLGLSITHDIINNHGGYMEVESETGVGTTMLIYLKAFK